VGPVGRVARKADPSSRLIIYADDMQDQRCTNCICCRGLLYWFLALAFQIRPVVFIGQQDCNANWPPLVTNEFPC
jgi:hypothetical protein